MSIIETLRQPKVNLLGMRLAVFDLGGTLFLSYLLAKQFNLNIPITVASSIPLSVAVHNLVGIKTPLTDKVNSEINSLKIINKS